jgi:hypothetical protein
MQHEGAKQSKKAQSKIKKHGEITRHKMKQHGMTKQSTKCHNLSLGLATKAKVCKSAGQEGSSGSTSYTPENARKCEKMSPHTPK